MEARIRGDLRRRFSFNLKSYQPSDVFVELRRRHRWRDGPSRKRRDSSHAKLSRQEMIFCAPQEIRFGFPTGIGADGREEVDIVRQISPTIGFYILATATA